MTNTPAEMEQALDRVLGALDRDSSVPLSVQLRGAIEFGIGSGILRAGTRLPSVRAMAARCGLSPVTVSGVYSALQEAGHIEARVGAGTYVSGAGPMQSAGAAQLRLLDRKIAELVRLGRECRISQDELARRVSIARPETGRPVRLLMVGNFHDATEAYATEIRPHLAEGDTIRAATLADLTHDLPDDIDMIVAPHTLRPRLRALAPDLPIFELTLIPNEATRVALASIPTMAQVVGYTYFPEFLTIMRAGIMRFAPHVSELTMVVRGEEGADRAIADADVLIYATGADYLLKDRPGDRIAFEYRHTPDNQSVRRDLLPAIEVVRAKLQKEETAT